MASRMKTGPLSKEVAVPNETLADQMYMLVGKRTFGTQDYKSIAELSAVLARRTTNIITRVQLHRTASLCAIAAEMPEMARKEAVQERALQTAFNRNRDLPNADLGQKEEEVRKFEQKLARMARFTPTLNALRKAEDKGTDILAALTMAVCSEPEEKQIPQQVAQLGIAGVFIRAGQEAMGLPELKTRI